MHHSIQKSPEQDISEKTSDEASGEKQPAGFKAFVPPPSSLQDEQQRQQKGREEIKNETVESRQPEDTSRRSGQSGHGGAAVVQHGGVAPHRHFTDEVWSLALGPNSCHLLQLWSSSSEVRCCNKGQIEITTGLVI